VSSVEGVERKLKMHMQPLLGLVNVSRTVWRGLIEKGRATKIGSPAWFGKIQEPLIDMGI
jgi:hypothetical protein